MPTSVDFRTISAFKRSLQCVNLNEFLTVYKSFDAYDCVYSGFYLYCVCFSSLSVFYSIGFCIIAFCLTRSDISAGNSLSVPQYCIQLYYCCILVDAFYGRPLSVSGRPCYILPMFFIYLFIFYGRLILRPWLTEVRENFTRGRP